MIPKELKEAISALDNNIRWRIIELLLNNDKLAYTEMLNRLGISKGSLNHHLTELMESGIVNNFAQGEFRGKYSSYYVISRFGNDLIKGLLSAFEFALSEPIQPSQLKKPILEPAMTVKSPQKYMLVLDEFQKTPTTRVHLVKIHELPINQNIMSKYIAEIKSDVRTKTVTIER